MEDVAVDWEVATDEGFSHIVQTSREHPTATTKARATAEASLAHSVHPEVTGLEPAQRYHYHLIAGGYEVKGCTKAGPEHMAEVPAVAFAFANCQSWQCCLTGGSQD